MELKGIITAMVTPFDEQDKINPIATEQLVNQLISKGIHGLFILGTNGEFHVLSDEEKVEFAKVVIDEVAGRVPVYVGTGGNSTQQVIELSQKMAGLGADALSIITPYFVGLTEQELISHYLTIADNVKIPIILYNIPKNTGINFSENAVSILASHQNIIGIKDSSGNIDNLAGYIKASKDHQFSVLSGSDSLILPALKIGATGAVAATSNVLTKIDIAIYNNWLAGNLTAAKKMQDSIEEFRRILKFGTLPSVLKYAIGTQGIEVGPARLPVHLPKSSFLLEIDEVMDAYHQTFGEL